MKSNKIDMDRAYMLAGITNESEKKQVDSIVHFRRKAGDGRVYAIVQEKQNYFIKETLMGILVKDTDKLIAEDFDYIGGLKSKMIECLPSYKSAYRRLSIKLNEIANTYGEYVKEADEEIENDVPEPVGEVPQETEQAPEEVEAPETEVPVEDEVETSDETDVEDMEDVEDETDDFGDEDMEDTDEEGEDEDIEDEDEDDNGDSLSSIVGRFTQQLGQIDEFSAAETKNVLNSVISVMKSGISKLDDSDITKLSKRIKKRGAKVNESDDEECLYEDEDLLAELDIENDFNDEDMEDLDEACWDGYKQEGMKDKGGKEVPNCVKKEEVDLDKDDMEDDKFDGAMQAGFQSMNIPNDSDSKNKFEITNATFTMNETEKMRLLTKKVMAENLKGNTIKTDNKIINAIQEETKKLVKEEKYRTLVKNIIKEKKEGKTINTKNPLIKNISEQVDREMKKKLIK